MFAHLFHILKANPYHDANGKFARKDAPNTHTFVSVGGKFSRSNDRDRTQFGVEQTAIGRDLKPLFNKHKEQRMSGIQQTVDQKFNDAIPPPAPARPPARPPTAAAVRTAAARAATATAREAMAARREELVAQRTALVDNNHLYNSRTVSILSGHERNRLQTIVDTHDSPDWARDDATLRLAGDAHGRQLAEHGLTLSSTRATAARVPSHHLTPDSFGRSLTDLNRANATRVAGVVAARNAVVGASLFDMSQRERDSHLGGLSRQARSAARTALTDHVRTITDPLDRLSHPDRQAVLDTMSVGQKQAIQDNQEFDQRRRWSDAATHHATTVREEERRAREGPNTGAELHGLDDASHANAMKHLSSSQRASAVASEASHARSLADRLNSQEHSVRAARLASMPDRQRRAVEASFTQEDRDSHAVQERAHTQQEADRAAAATRATAAAAAAQAVQDDVNRATEANMTDHGRQVHTQMKELNARGMTVSGEWGQTPPQVATAISKHYPNVTPHEIIDALMGTNAKIVGGTLSIDSSGNLSVGARGGSTVHGAKVQTALSRGFNKSTGVVEHGFLNLEKADRGMGAVKKNFAKSIPVYDKMGMNGFHVHGALEGGFHTWARYGFNDDNPPAWRRQALQKAKAALGTIPAHLHTPDVKRELDELDELDKKYGHLKEFPRLYTSAQTPHLDKAWADSGNGSQGADSKFKFDALANGNWYGSVKFSDKEQMQHLADYLGADMPYHAPDGTRTTVSPRPRNRS